MKVRYVYRSAITGKFVSAAFAKRRPKTTIRQQIKINETPAKCGERPLTSRNKRN